MRLTVNGKAHELDVPDDVPLLWVLREELGLLGTRFGCGQALCGACTVHVDGKARRSCVTPVGAVVDREVTTIEGLAEDARASRIQDAWIAEGVPQCGYCQAGQIMAASALLRVKPSPSDAEIDAVMSASLCRCGTYPRIRKAIHRAAAAISETSETSGIGGGDDR